MHKFMHVGFTFAGVPKVLDLEPAFTIIGDDWIRYSPSGWILWTSAEAVTIFWTLYPYLDQLDNVIITPIDMTQAFGRMPQWVWDWISSKRSGNQFLTGGALGNLLTGPSKGK